MLAPNVATTCIHTKPATSYTLATITFTIPNILYTWCWCCRIVIFFAIARAKWQKPAATILLPLPRPRTLFTLFHTRSTVWSIMLIHVNMVKAFKRAGLFFHISHVCMKKFDAGALFWCAAFTCGPPLPPPQRQTIANRVRCTTIRLLLYFLMISFVVIGGVDM